MPTPKKAVAAMLRKLPAKATYEEIEYRVYALKKIQRGLDDEAAGRLIPHEEVKRKMRAWLSEWSGPRKRRAI